MTEFDLFEQRLAAALSSYASEAEPLDDPFERARGIASAHPRRRAGWWPGTRGTPSARWAWIAVALLLAASAIVYVLAGNRQPTPPLVIAVDPAHPVPAELFGIWTLGSASGEFPNDRPWLDFNAHALIHDPDGTANSSLGMATAFTGTGEVQGDVTVSAPGECGEGRYQVALQDPSRPPGDPTAAPLPPGSSFNPTGVSLFFSELRLIPISDSCTARLEILQSSPWLRAKELLRVGATVNSLQFTEPFHIDLSVLPVPPTGDSWGTLSQPEAVTRLRVSHVWWNGFFLDDEPVFRDLCDPNAGTLPDIPATVEEAAAWLRSTASLGYGEPTAVEIDGRTALWVGALRDCPNGNIPAVARGVYGSIFYAIPTGDDVILWVVRPDTKNEADVADRLARSIVFD
jgi:hypothetical protein